MSRIFKPPKIIPNQYGRVLMSTKTPEDFKHLIGLPVNKIILFDDGTEELLDAGAIILPRHYFIFVGVKDGEIQYKPYEYNQYRIVVETYKDIIMIIESIG